MAGLTRDKTDDPAIKVLAFDIETSQYFQVGEMQGRLDTWGLARKGRARGPGWPVTHTWRADGLMPAMTTSAQLNKPNPYMAGLWTCWSCS